MDNETTPYRVQGSRVYGDGYSYNLTSRIDAEKLCNTLNTYEQNLQLEQNITKQYDKLNKQIIALQMDIAVVDEGIKKN